jgi:hypothetical protein
MNTLSHNTRVLITAVKSYIAQAHELIHNKIRSLGIKKVRVLSYFVTVCWQIFYNCKLQWRRHTLKKALEKENREPML